jgi:hypothetical protein
VIRSRKNYGPVYLPDRAERAGQRTVGDSLPAEVSNVSAQGTSHMQLLPRGVPIREDGTKTAPLRHRSAALQTAALDGAVPEEVQRQVRARWQEAMVAASQQAVEAMGRPFGSAPSTAVSNPLLHRMVKHHAASLGLQALDYPTPEAAEHVAELLGVRNRSIPHHTTNARSAE